MEPHCCGSCPRSLLRRLWLQMHKMGIFELYFSIVGRNERRVHPSRYIGRGHEPFLSLPEKWAQPGYTTSNCWVCNPDVTLHLWTHLRQRLYRKCPSLSGPCSIEREAELTLCGDRSVETRLWLSGSAVRRGLVSPPIRTHPACTLGGY